MRLIATWDGWNTPSSEADLWHFMGRAFRVDDIVMSPTTGLSHKTVTEHVSAASSVEVARDDGLTVVFFDERGDVALSECEHPRDAAYVFGAASRNANIEKLAGEQTVRIETPESKGLLWGHQAASIVLYDRGRKSWP